jgi:hypothetical protein
MDGSGLGWLQLQFWHAMPWGRPPQHFQTGGEVTPNPKLLCDDWLATDGIRASGRQHPIQRRHADGNFGLLSRKAAGSQPWSDWRVTALPRTGWRGAPMPWCCLTME